MKKNIIISTISILLLATATAYYVYRVNRAIEFVDTAAKEETRKNTCFELNNSRKKINISFIDKHSISESKYSLLIEANFGQYSYSTPIINGRSYAKKKNENEIIIYLNSENPEIEKIQWDGVIITFLPFQIPSDSMGRIDTVAMEEMVRRDGLIRLD